MMYSIDRKQPLLGAVCLAVALTGLAGCSMGTMQMSGPFSSPVAGSVTIKGSVHGGQQPILNSAIQLWVVGSGSYGAAATPLFSSSVTSGSTGSFSITGDYHCPSASSLVYLTASGGNPGLAAGTNNAAIELASPLGACGNLNSGTFLVVNEVTTAATAFALGQYFTPTFGSTAADSFGAPTSAQAQLGITNAFATAANLVSINSGTANTTLTQGATTVTPEATKVNTIANILASCVDSLGASDPNHNCSTLFSDVTPTYAPGSTSTSATAPTDVLQAAVYMSLNPTSNNANTSATNMAALYGLSQGTGAPYSGVATAPTDWTIGIAYTNATALAYPQNVAIDSQGNVWVANNQSGASGSLSELSPNGTALLSAVSTIGGQSATASNPRNLAIDLSDNAWMTSSTSSGYVFEYNQAGTVSGAFPTSKSGYAIAIDKTSDVYVYNESSSPHVQIFDFPAGTTLNSTSSVTTTNNIEFPLLSTMPGGSTGNGGPSVYQSEYMAFDTTGNLWFASGTSVAANENQMVELTGIDTSLCAGISNECFGNQSVGSTSGPWGGATPVPPPAPTFGTSTTTNTYTFTGTGLNSDIATPTGIVAAQGGGVWIVNSASGSNTIAKITSTSTGTAFGDATSLSSPRYLAMDGSGNLWVSDKVGAITGGSNGGAISEFSSAGTALSPTVPSANAATTNPGYIHPGLNQATSLAVDPSGNVWVVDNTAGTTVEEIVGAATPVVTPLAAQLKSTGYPGKP